MRRGWLSTCQLSVCWGAGAACGRGREGWSHEPRSAPPQVRGGALHIFFTANIRYFLTGNIRTIWSFDCCRFNYSIITKIRIIQLLGGGARTTSGLSFQRNRHSWKRVNSSLLVVGGPEGPRPKPTSYLTRCIDQMVLEGQLLHKIVNLLFQLVIVNDKLTIWWRSWFSRTIELTHSVR